MMEAKVEFKVDLLDEFKLIQAQSRTENEEEKAK